MVIPQWQYVPSEDQLRRQAAALEAMDVAMRRLGEACAKAASELADRLVPIIKPYVEHLEREHQRYRRKSHSRSRGRTKGYHHKYSLWPDSAPFTD